MIRSKQYQVLESDSGNLYIRFSVPFDQPQWYRIASSYQIERMSPSMEAELDLEYTEMIGQTKTRRRTNNE